MPPRLPLLTTRRLAFQTIPIVPQKRLLPLHTRLASDVVSKDPVQSNPGEQPSGANESQIPHVSEEQAAMDKIMGDEPVEIEERGTPVQEIMERDRDAQKKAPEVLKQEIKTGGPGQGQSRSFSTSARRPAAEAQLAEFQDTRAVGLDYPDAGLGYKFPLPDLNGWKPTDHLRRRYDPLIDQVTKSLMRDGKLSAAQRNMSKILETLRTAPPPQTNSGTNPTATPASLLSDTSIATGKTMTPWIRRENLPLSPIQYLTSVIDSLAPLMKIRNQRGVLGGGQSLPIPVPLRVKQRRRAAIKWIMDSAENNRDTYLADRVSKEIIKVANGTSSAWEKRAQVHRMAVTARSNIRNSLQVRRRRT